MEPESVGDFALRLHGLGSTPKVAPELDPKSDPLGYIMRLAGETPHTLYQGLLTNDPPQNMAQSMVRGIPAAAGATVGGIVGGTAAGAASLGLGSAAGGYAGMGMGGAGGEFLRQGLVGINSMFGNTQAPEPTQVAISGAKEGAIQALAPLAAKTALKVGGKTITGMTGATMDRLIERPSQVATSAMLNPEAAPSLAKQFVDAVNTNMDRAGEAYRGLINNVINGSEKYGSDFTINMKGALADTVSTIRNDFGYGLPGRLAEESDAKLFGKFAKGLDSMSAATPEEAYYFQRDLTNAIRNNAGKPVAAALGKLKTGVMNTLEQNIPEIGTANHIYKSASDLSDELSRVTNADNALSVIKNAFKNQGNTFDALGKAADQVAGGRKLLESIKDASAGAELSPLVATLPRTGFTAGLGYMGAQAGLTHNPLAQAAAVATAPFLSPRLVAYGTRAGMSVPGQAIERPAISAMVNQVMQKLSPTETTKIEPESTGDFALRLHGLK